MRKWFRVLPAFFALALVLAGCEEKADIKKDAMDPESLKALKNPPPGVPGPPPGAGQVPNKPADAAAAPGK